MSERTDTPKVTGDISIEAPPAFHFLELLAGAEVVEATGDASSHVASSALSPAETPVQAVASNPGSIDTGSDGHPRSLGEALQKVTRGEILKPELLRRIHSDIRTVASMTGRTPAQLPCDPRSLRPILRSVLPARFRITQKRWANLKATVTRLLKLTGWHDRDELREVRLNGEWESGWRLLPEDHRRHVFADFARWCQRYQVAPAQVTEETLEAYREWRTDHTLILDVRVRITALRRGWNWLVEHHPAWPRRTLKAARPSNHYGLSIDEIPPSLRAGIEDCCDRMARFTPLDPNQGRQYSRATITNTRNTLLRAAAVIAQKSGADVASLRDMRDLLNPAAIRCVLLDHAARVGNQEGWAASSPNVATILKRAARISQALDDTELREVERLCAMVRRQPLRLCRMARERLAQFDDPAVLHRLLKLPDQCFTTADRMLVEGSSKRAAILHLRALALAILITKPLRREDLAQLDLATDFRRDKEGRIVGLSIPGHKTKTGRDEEAWFERPLIKRIQRHLQVFRPLLASSHSTYLFPGQVHGHRSCNVMSDELKQLVQNQVGAMFNAHLVRHIAVQLLLEDHPDNMPVAQRLIGHGDLRMTERFYGAGRSRGAQRHWGDLLQRKMKQLERKLKV